MIVINIDIKKMSGHNMCPLFMLRKIYMKLLKTLLVILLCLILCICFAVTVFVPILIVLYCLNWIYWIWNPMTEEEEANLPWKW